LVITVHDGFQLLKDRVNLAYIDISTIEGFHLLYQLKTKTYDVGLTVMIYYSWFQTNLILVTCMKKFEDTNWLTRGLLNSTTKIKTKMLNKIHWCGAYNWGSYSTLRSLDTSSFCFMLRLGQLCVTNYLHVDEWYKASFNRLCKYYI